MKFLITGARGYLASYLIPRLSKNHELILTSQHSENNPNSEPIHALNLADSSNLYDFIEKYSPEYIINTAAVSLPDWAEDHIQETNDANIVSVQNLVRVCSKFNIPLLHMSTDYVFGGDRAPYKETDLRAPVNFYGKTKAAAEEIIETGQIQYMICRTTLLYGLKQAYQRPNPFIDFYTKLNAHQQIEVPINHFTTPTYVEDLVDCLIQLIQQKRQGIYHTAGPESISRYDFAIQLAEIFGFDTSLVKGVPLVSKRAIRPPNTSLSTEKLRSEVGIVMHTPKEAFQILKKIITSRSISF